MEQAPRVKSVPFKVIKWGTPLRGYVYSPREAIGRTDNGSSAQQPAAAKR
jgi:hypothetical protein